MLKGREDDPHEQRSNHKVWFQETNHYHGKWKFILPKLVALFNVSPWKAKDLPYLATLKAMCQPPKWCSTLEPSTYTTTPWVKAMHVLKQWALYPDKIKFQEPEEPQICQINTQSGCFLMRLGELTKVKNSTLSGVMFLSKMCNERNPFQDCVECTRMSKNNRSNRWSYCSSVCSHAAMCSVFPLYPF